jgi:hypothetical protein
MSSVAQRVVCYSSSHRSVAQVLLQAAGKDGGLAVSWRHAGLLQRPPASGTGRSSPTISPPSYPVWRQRRSQSLPAATLGSFTSRCMLRRSAGLQCCLARWVTECRMSVSRQYQTITCQPGTAWQLGYNIQHCSEAKFALRPARPATNCPAAVPVQGCTACWLPYCLLAPCAARWLGCRPCQCTWQSAYKPFAQ